MFNQPLPPSAGVPPARPPLANAPPATGLPLVSILLLLLMAVTGCESQPPASPLKIGDQAPDFSLIDAQPKATDNPVTLSHLVEKGPVVIIFNMGLRCPACAQDLSEYAARIDDFKKAGIQVIAVSGETAADTREDLETNFPTPFPLLFDPDNKIARTYGLLTPEGSVDERTFLIDQSRHILWSGKPDQPGGDIPQFLAHGSNPNGPH